VYWTAHAARAMLGTLDPPANHIRAYRTAMTRVKPTVYRTTLAPSATLSRTGRPASHVCACAVCDALLILSQTHALRTVMTATRHIAHQTLHVASEYLVSSSISSRKRAFNVLRIAFPAKVQLPRVAFHVSLGTFSMQAKDVSHVAMNV
jgi:hypothetical protein